MGENGGVGSCRRLGQGEPRESGSDGGVLRGRPPSDLKIVYLKKYVSVSVEGGGGGGCGGLHNIMHYAHTRRLGITR